MAVRSLVWLTFALTMFAAIGCGGPTDQADTCDEWTSESLAATYEFGDELDCGSMDETTTQAAAEVVLACMNDALDSGQPARASYSIDYEDGEYDNVSEVHVWHVRASSDDPRIVSSRRVRRTPEDGPDVISMSVSSCEKLGTTEAYVDAPDFEVAGWRLSCTGHELCP